MTVEQLDLLARPTDPDTSHTAAASITGPPLAAQQALVLETVHRFHRMHSRGATAWEVVTLVDPRHQLQQSVAARRLTDLARAGLVADSGERRAGRTGRPLIVWIPTHPPP